MSIVNALGDLRHHHQRQAATAAATCWRQTSTDLHTSNDATRLIVTLQQMYCT